MKFSVKLRSIVLVHPDFQDCINDTGVLTVRPCSASDDSNLIKKSYELQQDERKFIFDSCSILRTTDISEDAIFMKQVWAK